MKGVTRMKETGKVVEIEQETAYVFFNRTSMCAKCGACGMTAGQNSVTVPAKNTLNAKIGDHVELEFTSKNALTSSLIGYIFPLIMLFFGMWIGYSVPQTIFPINDVFAALLGVIFAFGAFFILKLLNPVLQKKFANVYTMVKIKDE